MIVLSTLLLCCVSSTNAALTFAQPTVGATSSASYRSASMPKMYNNAPHQTVIGSGASYRQDITRTPYHQPAQDLYYASGYLQQPSFIRSNQPPSGFGAYRALPPSTQSHSQHYPTLSSLLGVGMPAMAILPAPMPEHASPCPMSPFSQYLSEEQQEALHELITEARSNGATEPEVKTYVDRYVQEVLPPETYSQFAVANANFERRLQFFRRGKRSVENVPARFDSVTFRNRKAKVPATKVDLAGTGRTLNDFNGVPKSNTLEQLIEIP
uniref:Homeobox domain-containing protein n=1 Tax=Panagrellus redivivus TaxID=6233 RepID=A0A7E4ZWA9_PANRE